jgi:hypothetical protein
MKVFSYPNFTSFPPAATADKELIYYDTRSDRRYYTDGAQYIYIPTSVPTAPQVPYIGN